MADIKNRLNFLTLLIEITPKNGESVLFYNKFNLLHKQATCTVSFDMTKII